MKKVIKMIAISQLIIGIAVLVFAIRFNNTIKEVKDFESDTQKSLKETAVVIENTHDIYSNSAKTTVEAIKNIQKNVPNIKTVGWKMNGMTKIPGVGKHLPKDWGTPVVELGCNIDDFCKELLNYYTNHNDQNKKAIKQTAHTIKSASEKIGKSPFSNICNMIQKLCCLLGVILTVNGFVMMFDNR